MVFSNCDITSWWCSFKKRNTTLLHGNSKGGFWNAGFQSAVMFLVEETGTEMFQMLRCGFSTTAA